MEFIDLNSIELGTLQELRKALTAGTGTDAATFIGGRSLQVQDLEMTLVNAVFSQDEAKLFKRMKQRLATATVHEFTRRDEVGSNDGGVAEEGGDSIDSDQDLKRVTVPMKTLSVRRAVTLQMLAAQAIDDAKASEKLAGTLQIIRKLEKILFNGDSAVVPAEFDGLAKLIPGNYYDLDGNAGTVADHIIDLRGKSFNDTDKIGENSLTTATKIIRKFYGKGDTAFMSLDVMQDFQKVIRERIRFPVLDMKAETLGGMRTSVYPTAFGDLELVDDVFLQERDSTLLSLSPKKPNSPGSAITLSAVDPVGSDVSLFTADDAATYYYCVTAENKYGESEPDSLISDPLQSVAVAEGKVVSIVIAAASGTGTIPTGVKVYRSAPDADEPTAYTELKLVGRFAWTNSAAPLTVYDCNYILPDTSDIYVLSMDPLYQSIEYLQFLPLMEFTLYPTEIAAYPFLILLVGALGLKIPKRHVRIINVGHTGGWYS